MPVQTRSTTTAPPAKQSSNGIRTRSYTKKELVAASALISMKHGSACCGSSVNSEEKESPRPRRSCANY